MVKLTFTFDQETVEALRRTASRLKTTRSAVVRDAIQAYAARADRLSDDERRRMLGVLDRVMSRASKRTVAEVDAEIAQLRKARRSGGRRTRSK